MRHRLRRRGPPMKVWVIWRSDYEESDIESIWKTEDGAKAERERLNRNFRDESLRVGHTVRAEEPPYSIREFELEGLTPRAI
jgi:hypothetical protein